MSAHDVWRAGAVPDGELVRRVYARSWPATCRENFTADEVIARLGARDLLWWQRRIAASPVRFAGGPANGGFGFALAEPVGDGWDLTYLFCEPEAWGTGLADALHAAAVESLRPTTSTVGAWILAGNARSRHFFASRGWVCCGVQPPPWETTAAFFRYELSLAN
jgi:GNAT superfamily N-acetyltransferase